MALALSPSGQFLYVASGNLPLVFGYSVASGMGALTSVPESPFTVESPPFALAIEPSGHFLYAANFSAGTISGLAIDGSSGTLTIALGSPFAAGTSPISIAVHPAGKFLYVANWARTISPYIRSIRLPAQPPS